MDQKLQELTEKLFQEGVVRGNLKADQILADAEKRAEVVIGEAKAKAKTLVAEAEKRAAELDKNTRSELKLASGQMINALEQEIVDIITCKIVEDTVTSAIGDKEYIQKLILAAVTNWASNQELIVMVSPNDQQMVEDYFTGKAKQLLNKQVIIESANKIKAGFQIGPTDGSYKVSFTNDDFTAFFKGFIRPKIVELLFDKK